MSNSTNFTPINDMYTDVMYKAVSYAEGCYKKSPSIEKCDVFYTPQIHFGERHNATCPLQSGICSPGNSFSFELDTRFLNSRVLTINEEHACEFRQKYTCSPSSTGKKYIRTPIIDDHETKHDKYF
jgi:hypothetical protein